VTAEIRLALEDAIAWPQPASQPSSCTGALAKGRSPGPPDHPALDPAEQGFDAGRRRRGVLQLHQHAQRVADHRPLGRGGHAAFGLGGREAQGQRGAVLADPGQFGIGQQELEQHGQETFRYQEPPPDGNRIPKPDHGGSEPPPLGEETGPGMWDKSVQQYREGA
jgi:hypothetical protein